MKKAIAKTTHDIRKGFKQTTSLKPFILILFISFFGVAELYGALKQKPPKE